MESKDVEHVEKINYKVEKVFKVSETRRYRRTWKFESKREADKCAKFWNAKVIEINQT